MPELHTLTAYDLLTYLADASFKDTALLHEALMSAASACLEASPSNADGFNRYFRMKELVRASMVLQWSEASHAWLGE